MQRGPSAPDGGVRASSLRPASPAHSVLPAINAGAPPISTFPPRGVSPNVAKRAAWSTPRDRPGALETRTEQTPAALAVDAETPRHEQGQTPTSTSLVAPLEDALEVLHTVLIETDDQSDRARRRQAALEETKRLHTAEELELERTRLAADEQLQTTFELLQAELARERRLRSTGEGSKPTTAAVAPPVDRKSPSKRHAARLATRLRNSPLKPRTKESASYLLEGREAAEEGARPPLFDRDMTVDSLHATVREVKLHELREERARWQRDYELMREQVIEEKARQVALFQRLEVLRRSQASQLSEAEAALRASQADVERLQTRLAQARVSAAHEARRTASLVQSSRSERQRLVCALAETRHKFREWKEGEAATLRATREQAVHALRTEYELKLARHQEEKQKLRDKVKDLEVSLRLLQRDRQLSPGELSERKGTLLQNNSSGIGFGDVGAADFIEAHGHIHELEALLQLSKERQERQDALLRVSEAALARLSQERELDALENLSLPSPAVALVLSNLTGDLQVEDDGKPDAPDAPTSLPATETPVTSAEVVSSRDLRMIEREGSAATISVPPSTPTWSPPRRQSISGGDGTDLEKEVLRRKSIALSAEVNRYQKIVVQSMEEVRALKESRRRSRSGSISSSAMVLSPREAYLLEELAASQREIDAMKAKLKKKKRKKDKAKSQVTIEGINPAHSEADDAEPSTSSSESENSNDSSNDSENDSDSGDDGVGSVAKLATPLTASKSQPRMSLIKEYGHEEEGEDKEPLEVDTAVQMIQMYSKGFLARREFIRKKLAIGKIKARYRGYLVRKNYEALSGSLPPADRKLLPSGLAPQEAPDFLMVTEAMQYKMQIVEPHHSVSYMCEESGNVDVVLRVSKDPPVVQLQVTSAEDPIAVPRVAYFHLFETIALLSYEDEENVLETSSEKEIARIFASRLVVQRKGSEDNYHFFIARPASVQDGIAGDPAVNLEARTLLTELPVQPMEARTASASSEVSDAPLEGTAPPGQEVDLDLLIREARTDPLDNETTNPDELIHVAEDPFARIRRLVKRLSSSSFDTNE
ncbi:hypothetical protein PF005_g3312 [Phytophthora fragariae]|uniref:Uncharacterized protein n=1 Tax=Phytophthora fragariae TaxID=53985 RepID=A0A6A3QFG9_9STRA|nr:hypothetical protein PF003_g39218 [Phytophthora fragariae]KAE8922367.1 hypothetical protein PF009_g27371 [Phytophthora fragariae]KAE8972029.1 hypothetical protein PF011_g25803 [Phytophthora fragariae]KAE9066121.1 hypothetical protein PF007_g28597 [Phytophthora fragariae]KAE9070909.1 hypothetical protein PF010_g26087 [Phytophthora fragariae]